MKNKKIILIMILILFFSNVTLVSAKKKSTRSNEKIQVTLEKCVDGDTARFMYKKSNIKARFLAIDTPESVHPTKKVEPFGKEASKYTCDMLSNAKKIVLEYDINSDKTDKYDRHLVWVFVDDVLLQEELVSNGYAKIKYVYGDYKYLDELKKEEQIAKGNRVGVWSLDDESSSSNTNASNSDNSASYDEKYDSLLASIFEILKKFADFLETILNSVV